MDKLTGIDYFTIPIPELVKHSEFSNRAMLTIIAISEMTTEQLETLVLMKKEK